MLIVEDICREDRGTIEQIAGLEQEIFPDPWTASQITGTAKQHHTFCRAVREEGRVIGYYLCYYVLDECEIAKIAVAKEHRRTGVGRKLLLDMEEKCREKEITKILLDVRKSNETARAFYEKNGFEADGERKNYYGGASPEDAILMSKELHSVPEMEDLV